MPYRILAMDGGNGWNTATLLTDIETKLQSEYNGKGYLDAVDLFAGTSDGALNALFLAKNTDPTAALNDILSFWSGVNQAMFLEAITPASLLLGLTGITALSSSEKLREYFIDYFGASTTLSDLPGKVFIVSFQLDDGNPIKPLWTPMFYHNFDRDDGGQELVVDVAMRTTAFPILRPIYQALSNEGPGYVDGGVVANQPSMCALAEVYRRLDHSLHREAGPHDVLLFSIGTGQNPVGKATYVDPTFNNGFANWGYREWVMDPKSPLLLLNMILQSSTAAVDFQCKHILRKRYHRLNPMVEHDLIHDDPAVEGLVLESIAWMKREEWLSPAPTTSTTPTTSTPASGAKGNRRGGKTVH
jgi:patatin-like phospholipase/acyl hydrolase